VSDSVKQTVCFPSMTPWVSGMRRIPYFKNQYQRRWYKYHHL